MCFVYQHWGALTAQSCRRGFPKKANKCRKKHLYRPPYLYRRLWMDAMHSMRGPQRMPTQIVSLRGAETPQAGEPTRLAQNKPTFSSWMFYWQGTWSRCERTSYQAFCILQTQPQGCMLVWRRLLSDSHRRASPSLPLFFSLASKLSSPYPSIFMATLTFFVSPVGNRRCAIKPHLLPCEGRLWWSSRGRGIRGLCLLPPHLPVFLRP